MPKHPPKVKCLLLSYLCSMDKPKKRKRRTLVLIDGESLSPRAHYDFSFLESEKRLDIWFFFKNKIQHSFLLHKDYNAKSIVLPRYEEDTLLYILKRVCYELGRREGKYHKLYFIGDTNPAWEGLVQFCRERGYVAHHLWSGDYVVASTAKEVSSPVSSPETSEEKSGASPRSKSASHAEAPSQNVTSTPPLAKNLQSRKKPKSPLRPEHEQKLRAELTGELAGKTLSRKEFLKVLHKLGISVDKHVRYRSLKVLLRYLSGEGLVSYDPDREQITIMPSYERTKS
jgi:hypothetical protein